MKKHNFAFLRNAIFPCLIISLPIGVLTGLLIFFFKICSSQVISFSKTAYRYVRENPSYLPILILGACILGALSALVLKYAKDCRGGGIPTAIVSIRGFVPLKWVQSIFMLFVSAMLTYLGGVPLGSEGPSVQMGTAVGKGAVDIGLSKKSALARYGMTGGACAGFATALGAPLTGIIFALEEIHRRFTPTIFVVAAGSVFTATGTQEILSRLFNIDVAFFHFRITEVLPLRYIWVSIVIGLFCGIFAIVFTKIYRLLRKLRLDKFKNIPFFAVLIIIFSSVAIVGFLSEDFIGTGHDLIDKIFHRESVWYILIAALILRALLMIFANSEGVTGGLFIPTLAFGAIIAALVSNILINFGWIDGKYYPILITVGMASYLSAASRTPLTAVVFVLETLCGVGNIMCVGIGVITSYIIIELTKTKSYTDEAIEATIHASHKGNEPKLIDTTMVVGPDSFIIGKEIRDILWPPNCLVLSIDKNSSSLAQNFSEISEGDVLHIHYETYDADETLKQLIQIVGKQEEKSE